MKMTILALSLFLSTSAFAKHLTIVGDHAGSLLKAMANVGAFDNNPSGPMRTSMLNLRCRPNAPTQPPKEISYHCTFVHAKQRTIVQDQSATVHFASDLVRYVRQAKVLRGPKVQLRKINCEMGAVPACKVIQ